MEENKKIYYFSIFLEVHYVIMIRKTVAVVIFLSASLYATAQQEPLFSQYMFQKLYLNPGYAGTNDAICAMGLYRQQWLGFKDTEGNNVAPETYTVNIEAPVKVLRGGVGISVTNDKLGFEQGINLRIGYSYHHETATGTLGLGLMIGFLDKRIDFSNFQPVDDDPLLNQLGNETDMLIDLAFGAYYTSPGQFYVGFSSSQLIESRSKPLAETENTALRMQLRRHYYLMGGYTFALPGNPAFEIEPSMLFRTDLGSFQVDFTGILKYNDRFWGGLSYRFQDAVVVILGAQYKNIHIGYSYDVPTSAISTRSGGSHEIMAGYCFKLEIEKLKQSYRNTRFL